MKVKDFKLQHPEFDCSSWDDNDEVHIESVVDEDTGDIIDVVINDTSLGKHFIELM